MEQCHLEYTQGEEAHSTGYLLPFKEKGEGKKQPGINFSELNIKEAAWVQVKL